jgi:hypothetical protein
LYGAFVWARRALNSQKRRFPARAVRLSLVLGAGCTNVYTIFGEPVHARPDGGWMQGGGSLDMPAAFQVDSPQG